STSPGARGSPARRGGALSTAGSASAPPCGPTKRCTCAVTRKGPGGGSVGTETVLVTGGAGFIGSALCRALVARGTRVVAYDNLRFGRPDLLPADPRCVLVEGDVRDAVALRRALRDTAPQAVCHLAAIHFIPYCIAHPDEPTDATVNGTRHAPEACREVRPARLLFASTAAVYPAEEGPFTEEH